MEILFSIPTLLSLTLQELRFFVKGSIAPINKT